MQYLFTLLKIGVGLFWALVIYTFFGADDFAFSSAIKWLAIITIDIHVLEALWFLWWKGSDEVPIMPNVIAILLFGGLHLYPLYKNYQTTQGEG